jgi:hypothetical protein
MLTKDRLLKYRAKITIKKPFAPLRLCAKPFWVSPLCDLATLRETILGITPLRLCNFARNISRHRPLCAFAPLRETSLGFAPFARNNLRLIRKPTLLLLAFFFACLSHAQELSNIGKSPLLATNGGIALNQIFFNSNDSLARRDPYTYTFTANLNLSLYGWSVPVSAMYSNQKWSYSQPFNQFSLHPSYKWIKLHIGHSSMNFSPYTLAGHQFLGAGVELSPGDKFTISAMGGRLQKRTLPDSSGLSETAYHRIGAGFKTEYNLDFGSIAATLFYARDDENSLHFSSGTLPVLPMENLTAGLGGNFSFFKSFSLTFDYSSSILTENTLAPTINEGFVPGFNYRGSTSQYNAFKTGMNYNSPFGSLGLGFERVDPGYRTLGAYYNNNDFVNYTINYAGGFLKNRATLAMSFGLQEDNLSGENGQDNSRRIANINLGIVPIENLNIGVFYSNFNNYTNIRSTFEDINTTDPYANYDTLNFTQISENIGGTANMNFGEKDRASHSISLSASYQKASQQQNDVPENAGNAFYNGSAGYNLRIEQLGIAPGVMFNYSNSGPDTLKNEIFGPSASVRKSFLDKKLSSQLMVSYNLSMVNKERQGENTIIRLTAGYTLKKQHNFNLSCVTALRKSNTTGNRNETTIMFTYRYSFNWAPFEKNKDNNTKQQQNAPLE